MPLGIDVSNHQERIDWARVKTGFAWVKATEGRTFTDPWYLRNLLGARENGIPVGAYHYAQPAFNKPEAEADHFLTVVGQLEDGDLLPVLDFEAPKVLTAPRMNEWVRRWLQLVGEGLGCQPIFYSYPNYISVRMGGALPLAGVPLWLADYGPNDGLRHPLRYRFDHMRLVSHQFTSNGHREGIAGVVDLNFAPSLEPLIYRVAADPVPARRPLPGPRSKPAWFWAALREFLARRRGRV